MDNKMKTCTNCGHDERVHSFGPAIYCSGTLKKDCSCKEFKAHENAGCGKCTRLMALDLKDYADHLVLNYGVGSRAYYLLLGRIVSRLKSSQSSDCKNAGDNHSSQKKKEESK